MTALPAPGASRKERLGTKLSTSFIPTPARADRERGERPPRSSISLESAAESTGDTDDDAMEKRLKLCYTDDTYGEPPLGTR